MQTLEQFAPERRNLFHRRSVPGPHRLRRRRTGRPGRRTSAARSRQWTGIPVSVGIGPTKTLAKAANRIAKKDPAAARRLVASPRAAARHEALARFPSATSGASAGNGQDCSRPNGITTALAFSQQPDGWIDRTSERRRPTHRLASYAACPASRSSWPRRPRKGLVVSRSFGRRLTEFEPITAKPWSPTSPAPVKSSAANACTPGRCRSSCITARSTPSEAVLQHARPASSSLTRPATRPS